MELREILKLFKKHWFLYFKCACMVFLIGMAFFFMQPNTYNTSLMLNVTRKAVQKTDAYRYDDFYRLQADERFADTVVFWIGDPTFKHAVAKRINISDDRIQVVARRYSSQMISVEITSRNTKDGKKIAQALAKEISAQADMLNQEQKEDAWFMVLASESLTSIKKISFIKALLASLGVGIFIGFWAVLLKHYCIK